MRGTARKGNRSAVPFLCTFYIPCSFSVHNCDSDENSNSQLCNKWSSECAIRIVVLCLFANYALVEKSKKSV